MDKIREAAREGGKGRVIVGIDDLRNFGGGDLLANLMASPRANMVYMRRGLLNVADAMELKTPVASRLQLGFEGSLGENTVSPRGLVSRLLNRLVVVEGIVTKCSSVRPKLVKSVHYCPVTKAHISRNHRDETSMDIGVEVDGAVVNSISAMPTKDPQGNPYETEHGLSEYKDYQTVVLQEMPERARVGQLPRHVDLLLEYDLVDRVKPGDRVEVVGIYQPLAGGSVGSAPGFNPGQMSGVFPTKLVCNNVRVIGKEVGQVRISTRDERDIIEVGQRGDVLQVLSSSICPSIFGHEYIKRSLILQLLGGVEKNLANKTHLRGDINMMLIGDPSTAKSQLLRAVMDVAPLAISTTGRGSSGVGLTAAVCTDPESGERRLEAGAMVLADKGIVCIDEFDKMGENDRVAIHEVMEQQTVTIAKAGIHASLNARCSVIAAANPVYGQYDSTRRPQDNIGLPDSLLSRFDLLFIVLDQLDPALDRRLSEHVIKSHQYRRPGTTHEPEPLNQASTLNLDEPTASSTSGMSGTPWLRGGRSNTQTPMAGTGAAGDLLTKDFLRKYLHYARAKVNPELSDAAMELISEAYAQMRAKQSVRTLPVTARTLETLIRLSTAHAKVRLSGSVDEEDVTVAVSLVNFMLYNEEVEDEEAAAMTVPDDDMPPSPPSLPGGSTTTTTGAPSQSGPLGPENDENRDDSNQPHNRPRRALSEERSREEVFKMLNEVETGGRMSVTLGELMDNLSAGATRELSQDQVNEILRVASDQNRIWYDDETVTFM